MITDNRNAHVYDTEHVRIFYIPLEFVLGYKKASLFLNDIKSMPIKTINIGGEKTPPNLKETLSLTIEMACEDTLFVLLFLDTA